MNATREKLGWALMTGWFVKLGLKVLYYATLGIKCDFGIEVLTAMEGTNEFVEDTLLLNDLELHGAS